MIAPVVSRNFYINIIDVFFCIFDKNIKIIIIFENAGIHQFIFKGIDSSFFVGFYQLVIRKFTNRIFVQHFHVGMCRRAVEIIIQLFYIFTMIAFIVGKPKKSFFKNVIFVVPESQCQAYMLFIIRDSPNSVFPPSVST